MGNSPSTSISPSNSRSSRSPSPFRRVGSSKRQSSISKDQYESDYGIRSDYLSPSDLKRSHSSSSTYGRSKDDSVNNAYLSGGLLAAPNAGSHRRSRSASARTNNITPSNVPPPSYSKDPPPDARPPPLPRKDIYAEPALMSPGASGSSYTRQWKSNDYLNSPLRRKTEEDALEMLRSYDTAILVDDSSSMKGKNWEEASAALSSLAAEAGKYDSDGLDIYFINNQKVGEGLKTKEQVRRLFQSISPLGATPLGRRLEQLLLAYLAKLDRSKITGQNVKPINFLVITDGVPTDSPEHVIENAARRLDAGNWSLTQVGIQFVQIGNFRGAEKYLKELDDELGQGDIRGRAFRDIVDTTPYTGKSLTANTLIKILLGGINRRVDKKGAAFLTVDPS